MPTDQRPRAESLDLVPSSVRAAAARSAAAPPIDPDKQEQPHHIDEMPVPRRRFEADMLIGLEMTADRTPQANGEEYRTNGHMKAVESGRHVECRGIDAVAEAEGCGGIFIALNEEENNSEEDRYRQPHDELFLIVLLQCMVRPGH